MNALSPQTADALAATTILSGAGPDAELIALCGQFNTLERRRQDACNAARTLEEDDAADLVSADVRKDQEPLLDRIVELPCSTLDGLRAVASSIATWDEEWRRENDTDDTGEILMRKLVGSLLGLASAEGADANLIALHNRVAKACADADALTDPFQDLTGDDPAYEGYEAATDAATDIIMRDFHPVIAEAAAIPAITPEGIRAKARILLLQLGGEGEEGDLGRSLAHDILAGCYHESAINHSALVEQDADLLALRPEYIRLRALCDAENARDGADEDFPEALSEPFDAIIGQINAMPPATTVAGRALKAVAAMQELFLDGFESAEEGTAARFCWELLAREVGGAYRLPGERP